MSKLIQQKSGGYVMCISMHYVGLPSYKRWHFAFGDVRSCDIWCCFKLTIVRFILFPLLMNFWPMQYGFSRRLGIPNQMWRTHKYATDASLLMCKTILASFGVFCFHQFAGEKCVLPQYIERPGADKLFVTGIMRPAHHNSHAVNSNAPQALGFRCVNCKAEFGSRNHRYPWPAIADIPSPLELHAKIPRTPIPYHMLDVPVCYPPLFGNMRP